MRAPEDTTLLLDLLREAGDQAVTLDELEVVGVSDPATALLDLELAGHAISRVLDDRTECVRLAPFDGVHLLARAAAPEIAKGDASPEEEAFVTAVFGGDRPASADGPRPAQPAAGRRMLLPLALLLLALLLSSRR